MALTLYHDFPVPLDASGKDLAQANTRVALGQDSPPADIGIGTFLVAGTSANAGKYNAAITADFLSATLNPYYQVTKIYDLYGNSKDNGVANTTELAATQYYALVRPVGGCTWVGTEDGLVTPVTDAVSNGWCGLIVNALTYTTSETAKWPWAKGQVNILIDSSSATNTQGTLAVKLLGLAPNNVAQYSATASASLRSFRFQFVVPGASL